MGIATFVPFLSESSQFSSLTKTSYTVENFEFLGAHFERMVLKNESSTAGGHFLLFGEGRLTPPKSISFCVGEGIAHPEK